LAAALFIILGFKWLLFLPPPILCLFIYFSVGLLAGLPGAQEVTGSFG